MGATSRSIGCPSRAGTQRFEYTGTGASASWARGTERAKERETANLKRGLGLVATTGTTAPFIGLFGTVVGIINSFQGLSGDGGGGLGAVAGGISEALFATAVGLLVAIPAVAAYNYFTSRVLKLQIDMNDVASELVDYVLKEGRY